MENEEFFFIIRFDEEALHHLVTEKAYHLVTKDAKRKTIRWNYHGCLEPPRAVHVRQTDVITKDNIFAQITVRFHTQQVNNKFFCRLLINIYIL